MRFYSFTNMYLSSLQVGLQSGHCVAEMFVKYKSTTLKTHSATLATWAKDHKTMILLNGGYLENIQELTSFFTQIHNPHPWAPFFESQDALGGVQTTVGIILPEYIYKTAANLRETKGDWDLFTENKEHDGVLVYKSIPKNGIHISEFWRLTDWECELVGRLNTFSLAK